MATTNPVTIKDFTDEVGNVITEETKRLAAEKKGLDIEKNTRDRDITFTRSAAKQSQQYAYMYGVIVGALVICAIFAAARTIIPTWICDIISIVVLSGGAIWAYRIYLDISSRDQADFDQINPTKLISADTLIQPTTAADASAGVSGTGDLLTGPAVACSGAECCTPNSTTAPTKWDPTTSRCLAVTPITTSSFTSMDSAYSTLILPQDGLAKRNNPMILRSGNLN
jgi:hypothetical protein